MQWGLAGGLLFFINRSAFPANLDQIPRGKKPQRRVLSRNQEPAPADAGAYITPPAANELALKEGLSPLDGLALQFFHDSAALTSIRYLKYWNCPQKDLVTEISPLLLITIQKINICDSDHDLVRTGLNAP